MATKDDTSRSQAFDLPSTTGSLGLEKAAPESIGDRSNGAVTGEAKAADVVNTAQDLTSKVLDFLSHASNETLGACIVGLGVTTWIILGRVGLILIGIVVGVVLHATWENNGQGHHEDENSRLDARRRREQGLDVVSRVLDWRGRTKNIALQDDFAEDFQKPLDFSGFQKETASALTGLTDTIIHDYVKYVETWRESPLTLKLIYLGGGMGLCSRKKTCFQQRAERC